MALLCAILILMYSIILHEVSHGAVAYLNGDPTAKATGRLTLNPVPHADVVGTVILPLVLVITHAPFFIGWAKPVPFNPRYFRHRSFGVFTVALAGPLTNIILAFLFCLALQVAAWRPAATVFVYGASLNAMLAVFNLIPIPPLDGSRILGVFLPKTVQRVFFSIERWGFLIIILLLSTGVLHQGILPVYQWLLSVLFKAAGGF